MTMKNSRATLLLTSCLLLAGCFGSSNTEVSAEHPETAEQPTVTWGNSTWDNAEWG